MDPNSPLNLRDKIQLVNLKYHKVLFNRPHQFMRAFGKALGPAMVQMALKELTEVGYICEALLANANYHYNVMGLLAEAIADEISQIQSFSNADDLQKHLTFIGLKINLYYNCYYELTWAMDNRLTAVNDHWYYGWMIDNDDLDRVRSTVSELNGILNSITGDLEHIDEALFYMNRFYSTLTASHFLEVTDTGDGIVELAWSPPQNANNVFSYSINYGTQSGNYSQSEVQDANSLGTSITGLQNDVHYYFQLVPYLTQTTSGEPSNEVMAVPISDPIFNMPPSIEVTKPISLHEETDWDGIIINWVDEDPDDDADIVLYYDNDTDKDNGNLGIIGYFKEDKVDGHYWDVSKVPAGDYYILGEIADTANDDYDYSTGTVLVSHPQEGNHFSLGSMTSWEWDDDHNDNDDNFINGIPEGLETLGLRIPLQNTTSASFIYVKGRLKSNTSSINFSNGDNFVQYGQIYSNETKYPDDDFDFRVTTPYWLNCPFQLLLEYEDTSGNEYRQTLSFKVTFPTQGTVMPLLSISEIEIDDSSEGNGNGIFESGEDIGFLIRLENTGTSACINPEGILTQSTIWGSEVFSDLEANFPDIHVGEVNTSTSDYDTYDCPKNFSGNIETTLQILYGPDRNKTQELPLTITVHPAPHLKVYPRTSDFGVVSPGEMAQIPFSIKNIGTAPLNISSVNTDDVDTTVSDVGSLPTILNPEEELSVIAEIDTTGLNGAIERRVTIFSDNSHTEPSQLIDITGVVGDGEGEILVVGGSGHQRNPRIFGNRIVYSQDVGNDSHIFIKDLTTGENTQITSGELYCYYPDIYQNNIVWVQRPTETANTNNEIYFYNLDNEEQLRLTNNNIGDSSPRIWDDYIVYEQWTLTYPSILADIFLYQISTGQTTRITNSPDTNEGDPKTDGAYIIWDDQSSNIHKYNILNGSTSLLFNDSRYKDVEDFEIFNGNIIWSEEDDNSDVWDIYLHNGSQSINLTNDSDLREEEELAVWGNNIIYINGVDNKLYRVNINEGTPEIFVNEVSGKSDPSLYENTCVWADIRNGDYDIFMKSLLSENIAILENNIAFSQQIISVGQTITIEAIVQNLGKTNQSNIVVQFHDGDPENGGSQIGENQIISIGAGSSRTVSAQYQASYEGEISIFISIDSDNYINESNENDNKASKILTVLDNDTEGPVIDSVVVEPITGDGDQHIEENEQIQISWDAEDPSGIKNCTFTLGTESISVQGSYYATLNPKPVGVYYYEIQAFDNDNSSANTIFSGSFEVETSQTPGMLELSPQNGFSVSGYKGGSFSPNTKNYNLENTGQTVLEFQILSSDEWTTISPNSGVILPGNSTSVQLSINEMANELNPGTYESTIYFFNSTDGNGNTSISIDLTVLEKPIRTLLVESSNGGVVTVPGEGSFNYPIDTNLIISAQADSGYEFFSWTGSAVDDQKVFAPNSSSTSILITDNYTLMANFRLRTPVGFDVSGISGDTGEDGITATFAVNLTSAPQADVTISLASSDTGEGTVDKTTLTFTTGNWNIPQTVTVTGVDDTEVDGDQQYEIQFGAAVSSDTAYSGLTPAPVSVINIDNEVPNVVTATFSAVSGSPSGRWIWGENVPVGEVVTADLSGIVDDYDVPVCSGFGCCDSSVYDAVSIARHTVVEDNVYAIRFYGAPDGGSHWTDGSIELPDGWRFWNAKGAIGYTHEGATYTLENDLFTFHSGLSYSGCVCSDCGRASMELLVVKEGYDYIADPTTVLHYNFIDSQQDQTPYGHEPLMSNVVQNEATPYFNGTSASITIRESMVLRPEALTLEVIVYSTEWIGNNTFISQRHARSDSESYLLGYDAVNEMLYARFMMDDGNSVQLESLSAPIALENGVLYHLAVTLGDNASRLFVNHQEVGQEIINGTVSYDLFQNVVLGRDVQSSSSVDYFGGNLVEVRVSNTVLSEADFLTVKQPDYDGDGLSDPLEAMHCTDGADADTDDDGILDGDEDVNHNGQTDAGETNPCQLDTDEDDLQDGTETGIVNPVADPDGDGPVQGTDITVFQPDLDPGSTTEPLNSDTDGDALEDGAEDANHNGRLDSGETDPNVYDDFNQPPETPWNNFPADGAVGIDIDTSLSWSCSDPDDDVLIFDVYFGTANPPTTPVATGQSDLTFDPGTLQYSTTYYWRVDAEDVHGASTAGNVWHFTTEVEPNRLPGVTNQAPTEITTTTATGHGTITESGTSCRHSLRGLLEHHRRSGSQ